MQLSKARAWTQLKGTGRKKGDPQSGIHSGMQFALQMHDWICVSLARDIPLDIPLGSITWK